MTCPPITMHNIDAAEWLRLKAMAQAKTGVSVASDSGTYTGHGFTVTWGYIDGTLSILITNHPTFVSCDYVNGLIRHGIASL